MQVGTGRAHPPHFFALNPAHFFFGPKRPQNGQKPPKHVFFEIFRAIFSAQKCAEGAHTPYPLATTLNHPQKESGTAAHFFFGQKRPQNGQKRPKTVKTRLILRYIAAIFSAKKVRGGCARSVPTCNYHNPPPESLRNPSALF